MNLNLPTGYQILQEGITALAHELGRPLAVNYSEKEARLLSPEAARETLEVLRRQAEEGII